MVGYANFEEFWNEMFRENQTNQLELGVTQYDDDALLSLAHLFEEKETNDKVQNDGDQKHQDTTPNESGREQTCKHGLIFIVVIIYTKMQTLSLCEKFLRLFFIAGLVDGYANFQEFWDEILTETQLKQVGFDAMQCDNSPISRFDLFKEKKAIDSLSNASRREQPGNFHYIYIHILP